VKETVLNIISDTGTISFKELMSEVNTILQQDFDGSPSWYCTAVKLHLEAQKIIERIEGSKPQQLRIRAGWKENEVEGE
jgi:hypothetical protein